MTPFPASIVLLRHYFRADTDGGTCRTLGPGEDGINGPEPLPPPKRSALLVDLFPKLATNASGVGLAFRPDCPKCGEPVFRRQVRRTGGLV